MFARLSQHVQALFSSLPYRKRMDPATWWSDREALIDDLTLWILELNLAGIVCERRACDAARWAATGAFRSGATAHQALRAGKAIVSRHVSDPCS